MGVHRWLLGPVICLILAVASARPPECEEPPVWSIGMRQPLMEARGKQASSLESLLKHFRTYGMNDLEFMIVNSNLRHSQTVLHELENRVSFPVYQDTIEKNIWGLMEGGKDDIYVYDRCGRLAYYIPYPLSIMNSDEALVVSAILATYYRSPCGITCEKNNNSSLEDILNAKETSPDEDATVTTESYSSEPSYGVEIAVSTNKPEEENSTSSNETDIIETVESLADNEVLNKLEDFDYSLYNETLDDFEYNESSNALKDEFYNELHKLLFNNDTLNIQIEDTNVTLPSGNFTNDLETISTIDYSPLSKDTENHQDHKSNKSPAFAKSKILPPKTKSDRCIEADFSVCKNWSKKRLIRAHNCCSASEELRDAQMCRNFGKKRCKKLRTILKCCIKTHFIINATTVVFIETDSLPVEESTTAKNNQTEEIAQEVISTVNYDVVCCRNIPEGRLCRVVESPPCEEGEYISENIDQSEVTQSNPSK